MIRQTGGGSPNCVCALIERRIIINSDYLIDNLSPYNGSATFTQYQILYL